LEPISAILFCAERVSMRPPTAAADELEILGGGGGGGALYSQ
jgi:hypothetical protein